MLACNKLAQIYRVRLKKMTQHLKCDYSVMPENFCAKFCTLVQQDAVINVLFLFEITLCIRNWQNAKL